MLNYKLKFVLIKNLFVLKMDDKNFTLAEDLINSSYVRLGKNSINKREKIMKELLSQRQLP